MFAVSRSISLMDFVFLNPKRKVGDWVGNSFWRVLSKDFMAAGLWAPSIMIVWEGFWTIVKRPQGVVFRFVMARVGGRFSLEARLAMAAFARAGFSC